MKTIQKFAVTLTFCALFAATSLTTEGVVYYGSDGDGAVVECSSGNYGKCHTYVNNWCYFNSIVTMECRWTGRTTDYCSLVLVKFVNTCIDILL
jgi:hypothetical protein